MMKRISPVLFALLVVVLPTSSSADVRLPALLSDGMVLQRDSEVNFWGWADPGEQVVVNADWSEGPVTTIAGDDGQWRVVLGTATAGGPYRVTVRGKNTVTLNNVMLGEVWVCSGQSNMDFTIQMLGGWDPYYTAHKKELQQNGLSGLRIFTVRKTTSETPLDTCVGNWFPANADSVTKASATAYFFGRELHKKLGVPVGLIVTAWGGTPAETWTKRKRIEADRDLRFYLNDPNKSEWWPAQPGLLYNAMIHPLLKYRIKGAVWYQGESNRGDAHLYPRLMAALIGGWRADWGLGDFPFYYVQIAPFRYEEPMSGALLREAQLKTLSVPNTGMAVTMDIGDPNDIHPKNKQDVGKRLALWALAKTYGVSLPAYSGPLYRSHAVEGDRIRLFFDHADGGLTARDGLTGFTIAGRNRNFVDARAEIDGATVLVSSPDVPKPVAVRFAFADTSVSRLFNAAGLPASSFRTDEWPIVTEAVQLRASFDPSSQSIRVEPVGVPPGLQVRYTVDGSKPMIESPILGSSIVVRKSGTVSARAFKEGVGSTAMTACEVAMHDAVGKKATYATSPSKSYPAGDQLALVDGLKGSLNFRDGLWQGFERNDLDVTIDLGRTMSISKIESGFLQNTASWIFLPTSVEYSVSADGKAYTPVASLKNPVPDSAEGAIRRDFPAMTPNVSARYLRVRAKSIGTCPPWHTGKGEPAWLFVDEVRVETRSETSSRPIGYPDLSDSVDVLPGFTSPPPGYGNVAFYWWLGDTLTRERITWQMDQLMERGTTGLQINYAHSDSGGNIWGLTFPSQPALFSSQWWDLFRWFVGEAKNRGMSVSVSDYTLGHVGQGWYVDEMLKENPRLVGSKLQHVQQDCRGGSSCVMEVPEGLLSARAYRLEGAALVPGSGKDLRPMVSGRGLRWKVPRGTWRVILVHRVFVPTSFDPMHPMTGRSYNEKFFQRFEDHCPGEAGAGLNFFFSDELDFGIRGWLWNDIFAREFSKRKGYDILPELSALFADTGPRAPKIRMDYNDVLVALSEEHFFKPLYDWHTDRGMLFGCDHGGRGLDATEFGDYFRTQRWMSGPGCDQPFLQHNIVKNKVASSIAHLYERPRTWLEGYHSSNWGTSSADVADATFANFAMGQNLLSLHGLYYSTHGGWWEWAPPDNHWRQPYWAHMGDFMKCVERLSYVLSQGRHRCDIAMLYPVASMEAGINGEKSVRVAFDAGRALYSAGIDFDYMDFQSLARARVRGKELEVSGERYKVLILPAMSAVRFSTLRKALEFQRAGGVVLAIGTLPVASDRAGKEDRRLQSMVREIFGVTAEGAALDTTKTYTRTAKSGGKGILVPAHFHVVAQVDREIQRDFKDLTNDSTKAFILHRKAGERDVYFVYGAPEGTECQFRSSGKVELWNPWDGSTRPLPVIASTGGVTRLRLPLTAKDPQLVVFSPGTPEVEERNLTIAAARDSVLLDGEWEFEVRPTLDNRWGDYRLPAYRDSLGPEVTTFRYAEGRASDTPGKFASGAGVKWDTVNSAFGPQFLKLGPLSPSADTTRLETMLSQMDSVTSADVNVSGQRHAWEPYEFSWRWGLKGNPGRQGYHGLKGLVHDDIIGLGKLVRDWPGVPSPRWERETGGTRYYLWSTVRAPHELQAKVQQSGIRPSAVWINHERVDNAAETVTLRPGANPVLLRFDTVGAGYFVFEEVRSSPVVGVEIPLATSWYVHPAVLRYDVKPEASDRVGWYRCTAPPGAQSIRFAVKGRPRIWVDGAEVPVRRVTASEVHSPDTAIFAGRADLSATAVRAADVLLRVDQEQGHYGGAAIPVPMTFECSTGIIQLGNLAPTEALGTYSGGMRYAKIIRVTKAQAASGKAVLDLGDLVSSAEVSVNGEAVGTRSAPPWRFDVTGKMREGDNRIDVSLYNTVSNFFRTTPSQYIGRTTSGLLGPVELRFSDQK